ACTPGWRLGHFAAGPGALHLGGDKKAGNVMWMRFTQKAREAVFAAQSVAERFGENNIGPEHFLLAMLEDSGSVAASILEHAGLSTEALRADLECRMPRGEPASGEDMRLTPAGKRIIDLAYDEAR